MRKEQLIAIILGSFIGIGVAFGLWRLSKSNIRETASQKQQDDNGGAQGKDSSASTSNEFGIVSPQDFAVVRENEITLRGLSNSGTVIAASAADVGVGKSNAKGEFSVDLTLSPGINKVTIWQLAKGTEPKSSKMTFIYTAKIPDADTPLTSMFGTVTDIAGDTIQVRSPSGEIDQLSISEDTNYANIIADSKDIEFSDIAIGDYVAALGTVKDNVMEVQRILITTEPPEPTITAITGSIDTLSSKDFFVKSNGSGDLVSVDATNSVTVYSGKEEEIGSARLSDSAKGDEIVVIGEFKDDELVASTIILL